MSVGQTYFFSVQAVNGAGLTGSATNSNGQTVVTVSNVVYFSDNFENWTVHGGAWSSVNGESGTHTLDTSTDHAMAGSKCLKTTDTDTTATSGRVADQELQSRHLRRHLRPLLCVPAHRLWLGQFNLLTKNRTRVHEHQQLRRDYACGR